MSTQSTGETDAPQVIRFTPSSPEVQKASVQRMRIVTPTAVQESSEPQVQQASTAASNVPLTNTQSDIPTQQDYIDARRELNVPLIAASIVLIIGSGFVLRRFLF